MTSKVDVLVVLHNSKALLPAFLNSLRNISTPVTIHFLDNNSSDGTPESIVQALADLPFPVHFTRSLRNNGFARGMNLLARMSLGEFMFIVNPDTEIQAGSLEA